MFLISHAGEQLEPMEREQVESMILAGELEREDWVWDEHTESWVPLHEIFPENFPSFGADVPEDMDDSEKPTVAIPPADPMAIENFTGEGQRPKLVKLIIEKMREILEPGEKLLSVATQRKPIPDLTPESFALTNQRLFIFEKGHFKTVYDELDLISILHPEIKKGLFSTHITMSAGSGIPYGIKFIPKKQGIPFFKRLDAELTRVREAQRNALGANTRKAEKVNITPLVKAPEKKAPQPEGPQADSDETETSSASGNGDGDDHKALHHLEDLKIMLDKGLITPEDYETKKQKILDSEL